jgi:4'-phosphopantetheinyl transferase
MNVYWLEQTEADVPRDNDWLSDGELSRLDTLRFPKRRADWRLGRWTAKCAVAAYEKLPLHARVLKRIEIRPAPSGQPEVFLNGTSSPPSISLSHRSSRAMCAVGQPVMRLGCDLELIEPHSDAFLSDYFASEEQTRLAGVPLAHRACLTALLWSGKESALKALHEGLRLSSRCVIVNCENGSSSFQGWSPLHVLYTGGQTFRGWWRQADGMLRTIVANPSPAPPIRLPAPAYCPDHMRPCA